MRKEAEFIIDGELHKFDIGDSPAFCFGSAERLSRPDTDVVYGQPWYEQGFGIFSFLDEPEYQALHEGISASVSGLVAANGVDTAGFRLDKYHLHVRNEDLHRKVVGMSRVLVPSDFNFDVSRVIGKLERLLGFGLTDMDPENGERSNIIVRINRPGSTDFNPPHKDIYEDWDQRSVLPQLVNFWIPICGVTAKSSLPVAPGSHLVPEDRICRTVEGGVIGANRYRVRSVISWDGRRDLVRPSVQYGQVLVFSSHLIHGCAVNTQDDETRVALEFRLYKTRPPQA